MGARSGDCAAVLLWLQTFRSQNLIIVLFAKIFQLVRWSPRCCTRAETYWTSSVERTGRTACSYVTAKGRPFPTFSFRASLTKLEQDTKLRALINHGKEEDGDNEGSQESPNWSLDTSNLRPCFAFVNYLKGILRSRTGI